METPRFPQSLQTWNTSICRVIKSLKGKYSGIAFAIDSYSCRCNDVSLHVFANISRLWIAVDSLWSVLTLDDWAVWIKLFIRSID